MKTQVLDANQIDIAAAILKNGGVVGIPTETVYGLAADALNGAAVAKIFEAKGRPMDNPLIVHIADFADIRRFGLVEEIPESAEKLAKAFWPGPLTMIMKRTDAVPREVSAGLDTVAIRFPSHPVAQAIIRAANTPLAAPSANLSVLRPGGVTVEELREVLGEVEVDDAVLHRLAEGAVAASPGMKYKHYAPKANVLLLKGSDDAFIDYINAHAADDVCALCCDEDLLLLRTKTVSLGRRGDYLTHARHLFDCLRRIDENPTVHTVFSRLPSTEGVGLAVYNRLIRAAGFEVIDLASL